MTKNELRSKLDLFLELYEAHIQGSPGWTKQEAIEAIMDAIDRYENRSKFDPSKYSNE